MSKKNHDYTNYSKTNTTPYEPEVKSEVEPGAVNTVFEEDGVTPAIPEPEADVDIVEETETPEPPAEPVLGVVTECAKLNVRKEPKPTADIVTTLLLGSEVMINEEESTDDFYRIYTAAGVEGFCVKKFINTNS